VIRAAAGACCTLALLLTACATPALTPSPSATLRSPSPAPTATPTATAVLVSPPPPATYPGTPLPAATAAALQAALDAALRAQAGVGASAAVLLPGRGIWTGAAGTADLSTERGVTPATRFAIASITKTFVAAVILQLARADTIGLDTPVRTYLPDLPATVDPLVTVRELLNHTAGVADYIEDATLLAEAASDPARAFTPAELLARIGPADYPPGTSWRYSNADYLILGQLAEHVTGTSLQALLDQRFFGPLGLSSLVYQPDAPPDPPLAHGYSLLGRGPGGDTWAGDGYLPNRALATIASSAGGIAGTALDVARWGAALYAGSVLPTAALQEMLTFVPVHDYGLGVELRTIRGKQAIGHNGRTLGFATGLDALTPSGVVIAVLTNSDRLNVDTIVDALVAALPGG
jgi:D-alanyl-D-alanine carboxypeptidase